MHIISHFGTPLPPQKMPPWTFQDMPLPRIHNSFTTLLLQGPHSFSFFELKTFLKTFLQLNMTYCKKFAIFFEKTKDSLMFYNASYLNTILLIR